VKVWLIAALAYGLAAGLLSVAPIRTAITQAQRPVAPPARPDSGLSGPLPDAPDSPGLALGKVIGRQAVLVVGPPLLVLWFGWDVWFAVTGFLRPRRSDD
jgi:hypothetical protein